MSIFLFGVDKALSLVKENKEESLGRLLSRNPRLVHDRDRNGNTCLLIAALYNRLEIGLLLLLRGADINAASGKGYTALHISVEKGFTNFATMLCERGADCDAINSNRLTPLHLAVMNKTTSMINELCARGTMDAIDSLRRTPLHVAMQMGHVDLACMLVERGCDINIRDRDKLTPSEAARKLGYLGVCDIIDFRLDLERRQAKEREKEAREKEVREAQELQKRQHDLMVLRANPPPLPHTPTVTSTVVSSSQALGSAGGGHSGGSVSSQRSNGSGALRMSPSHAISETASGLSLEGIDEDGDGSAVKKKKKKVRTSADDASVMTGDGTALTALSTASRKKKKKKKGGAAEGADGGDDASTVVTTKSGAKKKKKKKTKDRDLEQAWADEQDGGSDLISDMVSDLSMSTLSFGTRGAGGKKKKSSSSRAVEAGEGIEEGSVDSPSTSASTRARRTPSRQALTSDPLLSLPAQFHPYSDNEGADHDGGSDLLVEHIAEDPRMRNAKLKSLLYKAGPGHGASREVEYVSGTGDERGAAGGSPVLCGLYRTPPKRSPLAEAAAAASGSIGSNGSYGSQSGASGSPHVGSSGGGGVKMRVAMDSSAAATTAALLRKERALQQGSRAMCSSPEARCAVM